MELENSAYNNVIVEVVLIKYRVCIVDWELYDSIFFWDLKNISEI